VNLKTGVTILNIFCLVMTVAGSVVSFMSMQSMSLQTGDSFEVLFFNADYPLIYLYIVDAVKLIYILFIPHNFCAVISRIYPRFKFSWVKIFNP
jgi:hypothetical protein